MSLAPVAPRPAPAVTTGQLVRAACSPVELVLGELGTRRTGLSAAEVTQRRARFGANILRDSGTHAWSVLRRQLRSPLLVLLAVTAAVSFVLGERTSAVIIAVILGASIGLGFVNEYRAERQAQDLHTRIRHTTVVLREGRSDRIDVTELVPGDVVHLETGGIVPADLRLLTANELQCDESVLTGESAAADKDATALEQPAAIADLTCCVLMGTVVRAGTGTGVVIATGGQAEFGKIALALGDRQPETDFQLGLRRFSLLLMQVAGTLTFLILLTNVLLHRALIDSVLFALAIAVGITPQLLPAVVSTSLAAGSRRMAGMKVLVKRLVCIEDLGDLDILVTDKTGTLTEGRISFDAALDPAGDAGDRARLLAMLASDVDLRDGVPVGGNSLDVALYSACTDLLEERSSYTTLARLPFDHVRQLSSVLAQGPDGVPLLITKGAPEAVLARCTGVPGVARTLLDRCFAAGDRVIAVAQRPAPGATGLSTRDEHDLRLAGILTFRDRPRADAAVSLRRLAELGVSVKIATGDHPLVAEKVCADIGLASTGTLTGTQIDALDDVRLAAAAERVTILARVSPEQKARVIRLLRHPGRAVGFLGDGVNDSLALHAADVGISVDTASDVAKDAADILLLEKDLGVIADGITEGRRIFANTIKYVLMGTSSNFGNMFSAAGASALLSFLPMLPSQILLNNLLYDSSQLAIPTDHVDPEQLQRPSHWDIGFIRRFMLFFGLISSLFDFLTFAVMLGVFQAGPELFRTGWFVESLATQTLIIFAVRTRRTPFWTSRPSLALTLAALGVVTGGFLLTISPLAGPLGFTTLPLGFLLVLLAMIPCYLLLIETGKRLFYADSAPGGTRRPRSAGHRIHRRASRFSLPRPAPGPRRPGRSPRG